MHDTDLPRVTHQLIATQGRLRKKQTPAPHPTSQGTVGCVIRNQSNKKASKQAGMNDMAPGKKVAMLLSKRATEWEPGPELMNRPFGPKSTHPPSFSRITLSPPLPLSPPLSLALSLFLSLHIRVHSPSFNLTARLQKSHAGHASPEGDQSATSGTVHAQPQQIPTCMAIPPPLTHDGMAMSTHP